MATQDTCCTIVTYLKAHEGQLDDLKEMCEKFAKLTEEESKCLYYGFSFDGDLIHCRQGYEDAEGVLVHLANVSTLLEEALKIGDVTRLEIHGPESKLATLREPLRKLKPQYFVLGYGFRR